ncbi:MAG: heparin lyase I family protein, partial [Steroidobacteraceae bacterium]
TQDYVQTPEGQQKQSDRKRAFAETRGQIARGKWSDWVMEYRPDWRSRAAGGTGVTRIWCNGTNVINYLGPNCVNNTQGPYIKFGCYKSRWKNAGTQDNVSERLYYFDEVRVSRPNLGSYTDVALRGTDNARSMLAEAIEAG